jgi:hypothetical protein
MYICPSSVTVTIYRENDQQFYSVTLPAHTHRDIAKVQIPAAVGSVLNKSRTYRIVLTAAQPAKFYADASRVEFIAFGAPRHQALQQKPLSAIMGTVAA